MALTYFKDGDLPTLTTEQKAELSRSAAEVEAIPDLIRSAETLT
jgi:hypothetical protein